MNYKVTKIAEITGGKLLGQDSEVHGSVIIDSRAGGVGVGDVFVALGGGVRDGHNYIGDAYAKGVRVFMVKGGGVVQGVVEELEGASFVVVEDTLVALQKWAEYHRSQFKGQVVGITGSNGKTVIKEHIAQLWNPKRGRLFRSPRSYNSQIGVALSLLMIQGDEKVAIIEAGVSKSGEMKRLQQMIRPTLGVLTNIGDAHSENFYSVDDILDEKLLLMEGLSEDCIVRGDKLSGTIEQCNGQLVHEIYRKLKIEPQQGVAVISLPLRLDLQAGVFGSVVVNDSYSNDLTSLLAALDFARREADGRGITVVLSDMEQNNCGYQEIARHLVEYGVGRLVGIGGGMVQNAGVFAGIGEKSFYATTDEFLTVLNPVEFAGQVVLIKGARSFGFEQISNRLEERTHTTVLEVNLTKIVENFHAFQSHNPELKVMAMVKADAYGLGAVQISRALVEAGVSALAVAYADEGVELRRARITAPVVVLNSDPGSFAMMIENNLEPEIYSIEALREFVYEARKSGSQGLPIHLKLDTGMHRLGFMSGDLEELCNVLRDEADAVKVSSVFTHLAAADDPHQDAFTRAQISLFEQYSGRIIDALGYSPELSITNSAGTERFPQTPQTVARAGIALYLNTATLTTKITQIKPIKAGESIGYNRLSTATHDMKIAVIPIGYADGLDRRLSCGVGSVMWGNIPCPIVGNVCMDTTMIDISGLAAKTGDKITILGTPDTSETKMAEILQTIPYEILCKINKRIKRLYSW